MSAITPSVNRRGLGVTSRRDAWWIKPLLVFLGFSAFIVYSTWAAFQNADYWVAGTGYLSPFYSPQIFGDGPHAWLDEVPAWMPRWVSPAFLILWAPAGFRLTCYYYRGAYYKAFWADPPACAVGEPRQSYWGENSLPLILQNLHRFMLYFAMVVIVFLAHDAWKAMWFGAEDGAVEFGLGVGSLVLALNVVLLGGYTFGCHSLRHLVGGGLNAFSGKPVRAKAWSCVSCLNKRHQLWAWFSLFWVGFTDLYVRLCANGNWSDARIF